MISDEINRARGYIRSLALASEGVAIRLVPDDPLSGFYNPHYDPILAAQARKLVRLGFGE